MFSLLISDLTFVFLLLSLLVTTVVPVRPDISMFFFFRFMSEKKLFTQICFTKYQTYLVKQWNNFTHETRMC